jgi:hypothetical protein
MTMDARDIKFRDLILFRYAEGKSLLCRVELIGRGFYTVRVLSATPEQVIESGYGCGEHINTQATALHPVAGS